MAKPKLALIPATQGSKFYSVLPADGVGDFHFTRSSSATRINAQGLIETVASGVSRLNYPLINGVVNGCPSHLLEPSRSNLNTYSDPTIAQQGSTSYASVTYQNNYSWGLGNVINNAIVFGDNSTTRYAYYNSTVSSGTEYTLSAFIKMDDNSVPIPVTDFLIVLSGTAFASGYNVESYRNNIYRVSVSGTAGASNTANGILKIASHSTKGFAISGFQLEQGSYATSYIPTSGSAVTRSDETANGAGDATTFNSTEGVLMAEISALTDDEAIPKTISIINSISTSNLIRLYYYENKIVFNIKVGGATVVDYVHILSSPTDIIKVAFKYKQNDFAFWVNGIEVGSDSLGNVPTGLNVLSFDYGGGSDFYGKTKQIQYFDSALTDAELAALTQ
mgnify:CR=1 FL=1